MLLAVKCCSYCNILPLFTASIVPVQKSTTARDSLPRECQFLRCRQQCRDETPQVLAQDSFAYNTTRLYYCTETHALVLAAIFSGGPGLASTRMSPFWILLELRMMKAVVTSGGVRRQRSSQIITTNKPTLGFLQAGCPSCRPIYSVGALKVTFLHQLLLEGSGITAFSVGSLPVPHSIHHKQAVGGRPPRYAPAPLLPLWAPKRLAPLSTPQCSSSFPRPIRSHAHRCLTH